ncbi:HSP90 family protein [Streptomyces sp. ISL-111]|uniref:HSP90 family protein n=1 Tax=unclassified Streptomyces TaxID=2593676 RepID=UPI001BE88077|nr:MULTISPECIES: HSP90 family protein [unclassified Streptomyces]MBT2379239.1 HSP90 family protein [Streptomyces sp. ISL-111]MBT2424222.1 HSP90 family protein [Streptomyces sp. ISL-112]MBT2461041.1 HSP90 family protein [Streptomyces sp. ISL-63]
MTLPLPVSPDGADRAFQVDLRGLVDLLSHHLYSSPRVYLRELLQNAVDALTARRGLEPDAPADAFGIRLFADGSVVRVEDDGVGLSEADVHTFLATIGRSSKRADGIAEQRGDFIGQFGIGLLSCFLVADEIHVLSRSARTPDAPAVEWRGHGDGSYSVRTLPASARPRPGTTVTLTPRSDTGEWTRPAQVYALGRHFGSLLRHPVTFSDGTAGASAVFVNPEPAPWARTFPTPGSRSRALAAYGEEVFGFAPLDTIELDLPAVGLRGIACVLPEAVPAGRRHGHRVHVKGMLLSEQADEILPEWAFFVRCVIDAESLRPTASRESLYEDDTLAAVRDALAERLRAWIARAAASDPDLLGRFLQAHHLAVKSLAVHDDEILRLLLPWLPFETTDGHTTLDEFARTHRTVLVTSSVEEFRQVSAIASAAGLGVVNGGYTYDRELVHRLPEIRPEASVADLDPATLTAHLDPVDRETELAASAYLALARDALAVFDCDVALRTFHPASAPALLVDSREARHERTRSQLAREQEGGLWGDILGALRQEAPRAQLILNQLNPLVRTAVAIDEPELARTSAEALYGQAALLSRRPLRPAESSLINRSFLDLLAHALRKDS